jgi:dTDP-glucose 4,6-dehydratase
MKILVTGGAGFIGSSFVNLLNRYSKDHGGFEITVVDKMTYAANPERLPEGIRVIEKDICDITKEDIGEVDYIVNFAAESHVDNSIYDGTPFMLTNIIGVYNLIEVAKQMSDLQKFVQISTDEVYGDLEDFDGYSKENDVLRPSSYYSSSKSAADQIVMSAGRTFNLPYLITRTCNNYGSHQHLEKFLPTVTECIRENIPVPLYGDGGQIREWIWVEDNVRIIFDLMISDIGIWNIGSGDRYTNKEILKIIGDLVGQPVKYNNVTDRLGHDRRYGLDSTKLHKFMGEDLTTINLVEYLETQLI